MNTQPGFWRTLSFILILMTMLACGLTPTSTPTLTPGQSPSLTPSAISGGGNGNIGGNGNGSGNASGNSSGNASGGTGGKDGTNNPANTPTPTTGVTPEVGSVSYVVKQFESLGHETISGDVCSTAKPFTVNAVAPEVSWVFNFAPLGNDHGNWTYGYSIPKAGESHEAAGTYNLAQASADGTLLLTMSGSDHVVFKGFDGNIPVRYKFNLAPSQNAPCP